MKKVKNNKSVRPAEININDGNSSNADRFKNKYDDIYNEFNNLITINSFLMI